MFILFSQHHRIAEMDAVSNLVARNAANQAANKAKGAAGKIQWKNFTTYAKILVWVAILGHLASAPYLMLQVGSGLGILAGGLEM